MNENLIQEEMMAGRCSLERFCKAIVGASFDSERHIEVAGSTFFILERIHKDNMIHRWIDTRIAVSANRDDLIAFCRKLYGEDIEFDEQNRTKSLETDMGIAYFQINTVALV